MRGGPTSAEAHKLAAALRGVMGLTGLSGGIRRHRSHPASVALSTLASGTLVAN